MQCPQCQQDNPSQARFCMRCGAGFTPSCSHCGTELPVGAFDAVTMGDVLEHLVRPDAALERIAGLLRPGGVLWLALPDAGSRVARTMTAALVEASRDALAQLRRRAAEKLQCAADELDYAGGTFRLRL